MLGETDTIAAIATPPGEGGVGIIRISGPKSLAVGGQIFQSPLPSFNPQSHHQYHGWIFDPQSKEKIDEVLFCYMKEPRSYTAEDVVEISAHGGITLLRRILELILREDNVRLAEPGEFTKRAFMNGRLDLAQAEAVIDLIRAKTFQGAQAAAQNLGGKLSQEIHRLREELVQLLVRIEAAIDFSEDVGEVPLEEIIRKVEESQGKIREILKGAEAGKILYEGVPTVIVGKPNVGKSSLLNALLRFERAIVTEVPGTTRDTLEEMVNIQGIPLKIIDTAGLRKVKDKVEKIGVERTRQNLRQAELVFIVLDASGPLSKEDLDILEETKEKKRIVVWNKMDLGKRPKEKPKGTVNVEISALTGAGIKDLEDKAVDMLISQRGGEGRGEILLRARHKQSLEQAGQDLKRVAQSAADGREVDMLAIDIKEAIVHLGEVTGEEVSEEVIERIFAEFCVGK